MQRGTESVNTPLSYFFAHALNSFENQGEINHITYYLDGLTVVIYTTDVVENK